MTDVDICSLALTELGVNPITSFSEDSKNAKLCKRHYPLVRDAALEDHPWNFAAAQADLSEISAPLFAWSHRYQLPNDPYCLVVRHMEDETTKFEIQGDRTLLTDVRPARIAFTFREINPTNYSPMFIQALVFLLASVLAIPIKNDKTIANAMLEQYDEWKERAKNVDTRQGVNIRIITNQRMLNARK